MIERLNVVNVDSGEYVALTKREKDIFFSICQKLNISMSTIKVLSDEELEVLMANRWFAKRVALWKSGVDRALDLSMFDDTHMISPTFWWNNISDKEKVECYKKCNIDGR